MKALAGWMMEKARGGKVIDAVDDLMPIACLTRSVLLNE
jgi:hypothetical protein